MSALPRLIAALRRFARVEHGQALLEFALVMPILMLLLVGTIEMGQAWRSSQGVTHAAREGARLSVIPTSTEATVRQRIRDVLADGSLDPVQAEIELRRRTGTGTLDTVTVRYPYQFRLLGPATRLVSGNTDSPGVIRLKSTFVMRNE